MVYYSSCCKQQRKGGKEVSELQIVYTEKDDDKELSDYDVDVLCDASEDYEAHKEQCDKLYDMVEDEDDDDN